MKETELRQALEAARAELEQIHEGAEDRSLNEEEQRSWDEKVEFIKKGEADLKRMEEAKSYLKRGYTDAPNVRISRDPQDALNEVRGASPREARRLLADANLRAMEQRGGHLSRGDQVHFEQVVKRHASDTAWATGILARQSEAYEDAFQKMMTGREWYLTSEEREALQVGSNTAGGYLLPTHLDPTIILTNSGSSNVIRGISRVVTLSAPGAKEWNGVTSAGVTASFDAELAEVSDDSPTFGRVTIPVYKAAAFAQASVEAFEDIAGLAGDLTMLFADARDRLEGAAHATGAGSTEPTGIFTTLGAGQNVVSTTAATIGLVDIHATYDALPVRWRSKGTWLTNPKWALAVKALGDAVSASYSGDLREPTAGRILGHNVVESDDAPEVETTTALDHRIIYGDFSQYVIVDKPGSMAVEYIPHMFHTSNNLPKGVRGWYVHWRTGADSVNDAAFRRLVDKTSA